MRLTAAAPPTFGLQGTDPPVTTLSLQVLADGRMQEALAAVRRAARAMDQVAACVALPIGLTTWVPADQQAVHEQLAESAAEPATDLQDRLREARDAVTAAAREAATAARAEPGLALAAAQVAPAAALEALTAELARRVALTHDDLARRAATSSVRYRILLPAMAESQAEAGDARRDAAKLRQLPDRKPARDSTPPPSRQASAGPTGQAEPDSRTRPPWQAEAASARVTVTDRSTTFIQPTLAVAAGPGTDKELLEAKPVLTPSDLAGDNFMVVLVEGESMAGDDIHDGYHLVVDTQRKSIDADEIAVFEKDGPGHAERFVKRVSPGESVASYRSGGRDQQEVRLTAADNPRLLGKVVAVIRTIG